MLISSGFLKSSYDRFKANREKAKKLKEGYVREGYNLAQSSAAGISASFDAFLLVVAIIFFVLELFLLFYAISLALMCTKPGPERVVHVTLAIIFTLPYILISVFFSKCAQATLQNSDLFLSPLKGGNYARPSNLTASGMSFT